MDRVIENLVELSVVIHTLEIKKHQWSNLLMSAPEEEKDRCALVLDSIDRMLDEKRQEVQYAQTYLTRPIVQE